MKTIKLIILTIMLATITTSVNAAWRINEVSSPMDNKVWYSIETDDHMSMYDDRIGSYIMLQCHPIYKDEDDDCRLGLAFNYLNLTNGEYLENRYRKYKLRIKIDDEDPPRKINFYQKNNKRVIFLDQNTSYSIIHDLKNSKKLLVEFPYYAKGKIYIEYNVEGLRKILLDPRLRIKEGE